MTDSETTETTGPTQDERDLAAAAWIEGDDVNASTDTVEPATPQSYDDCLYDAAGGIEWLILDDQEADARATEAIERDLWAFRASFLCNGGYLPEGITEDVIETLQQAKSEDAQPAIRAMVGDRFDQLAEDAIMADGRGHFLSGYDGEEREFDYAGRLWYAYRVN